MNIHPVAKIRNPGCHRGLTPLQASPIPVNSASHRCQQFIFSTMSPRWWPWFSTTVSWLILTVLYPWCLPSSYLLPTYHSFCYQNAHWKINFIPSISDLWSFTDFLLLYTRRIWVKLCIKTPPLRQPRSFTSIIPLLPWSLGLDVSVSWKTFLLIHCQYLIS